MRKTRKPKLAVWKFSSCDGCQLSLLNCEDELLKLSDHLEIAYFLEASRAVSKGPYDISLVEGSITTPSDQKRIQEVRKLSRHVITIGACATAGGIQALKTMKNVKEYLRVVYAKPEFIETLEDSTAISQHIHVDFELRGCPINKQQLLEVLSSFLKNKRPHTPTHSVCVECKLKGNPCIMVSQQIPCLGPVTQAGCDALCPSFNRGCYGCYGPMENPNTKALKEELKNLKQSDAAIDRLFSTYNVGAPWEKI